MSDPRTAAPEPAVVTVKRLSATNAGTGVWLILAPFLLGYAAFPAPLYNDIVCGLLIAVLGFVRFGNPLGNVWASYTNAGIGAWLVVAPFVLTYSALATEGVVADDAAVAAADPVSLLPATANDIVVGILVIALGVASARATPKVATRV